MLVSGVQQSHSVIRIHVSILFQILFPFRLLQSLEQSSLCYAVGPCWLSILNIAVCICQFRWKFRISTLKGGKIIWKVQKKSSHPGSWVGEETRALLFQHPFYVDWWEFSDWSLLCQEELQRQWGPVRHGPCPGDLYTRFPTAWLYLAVSAPGSRVYPLGPGFRQQNYWMFVRPGSVIRAELVQLLRMGSPV